MMSGQTLLAHVVSAVMLLPVAEATAEPIPVEVRRTEQGWTLLRGGEPFRIKGAGGTGSLELLAAVGGNAIRTWGAEDIGDRLDAAHAQGIAVAVGIWLGHERHGFDYSDVEQVAEQYDRAGRLIRAYKDHPAVLLWGIGNEMEGFGQGDDAAIWSAVNNVAALAKRLDPHHPTMTVTAEIGGERVKAVHRLCPDIDIMGINAYGGVTSLPERYRKAGGTKPYIVTETGPPGAWEVEKTGWGAPIEPNSTEKASFYRRAYDSIAGDEELALGSFMFVWGYKRESTATWFGMFLRGGQRTAAVDVMAKAWSGETPANQAPRIMQLIPKTDTVLQPGETFEARLLVEDPDDDKLRIEWKLEPEEREYLTGGDAQPEPAPLEGAIKENGKKAVAVRMPEVPGRFRLYGFAFDGAGGAAVANVPLKVRGEEDVAAGPALRLPVVVAGEGESSPWIPSGHMGTHEAITMDPEACEDPHRGETCLRVRYQRGDEWAGVAWQHPANDWGDQPGGFDLSGSRTLSFWARGGRGGERVKFGFGLLKEDKDYFDTAREEIEVKLTDEWKRYRIDLKGKDLRRIKTPFYWVAAGQVRPLEFYIDDVRFE
jgi:hypothetical protein